MTLNTNVSCNHRYPSVDSRTVKALISCSMSVSYAFMEKGVFVLFNNAPCSTGNGTYVMHIGMLCHLKFKNN